MHDQATNSGDEKMTKMQNNKLSDFPDKYEIIEIHNPQTKRMKKQFKCLIDGCNKIFNKSCNLRDHFRMHSGERPYQCTVCGCDFS